MGLSSAILFVVPKCFLITIQIWIFCTVCSDFYVIPSPVSTLTFVMNNYVANTEQLCTFKIVPVNGRADRSNMIRDMEFTMMTIHTVCL